MTVDLFALDGSFVGPAKISDSRAYPSHVVLAPMEGGIRLFVRQSGPTDHGEYQECKPVLAELIAREDWK